MNPTNTRDEARADHVNARFAPLMAIAHAVKREHTMTDVQAVRTDSPSWIGVTFYLSGTGGASASVTLCAMLDAAGYAYVSKYAPGKLCYEVGA